MDNLEYNVLLKKLYNNPEISQLINEYNLSDKEIKKNLVSFLSYLASDNKCKNCPGIENCPQAQQGMKLSLKYTFKVEPYFTECSKLLKEQEDSVNHLHAYGYNFDELVNQKVDVTKERAEVLSLIKEFLANYKQGIPTKGLYLHGSHGSGKTFLLAYTAANLAQSGVEVMFLFYPDLIRKLKSLISSNKLEKAINELKTVDVLMLDDFGAESCSAFVRDEILGPILQERMNNHLPTFMTSNLDDDNLIDHLSETNKSTDILRSTRIRARMQALMHFVELTGKNYRN